MVGIPTRKANSVAAGRAVSPASMAAKIVAAEREVPGKIAARIWQTPTQMATFQVTRVTGGRSAIRRSIASMAMPPMISASAMGRTASASLKPSFVAMKPRTEVIRNATVSLAR